MGLPGLLALLVDELQGISALALLAPQEELEIIVASAAAVNPWGQVELAGARARGMAKGWVRKKGTHKYMIRYHEISIMYNIYLFDISIF